MRFLAIWLAISGVCLCAENVKDHGAVGDGRWDDTVAIQRAADISVAKLRAINPSGGSFQASIPELYFPAGKYLISKTINLQSYQTVKGEDAIVIQQDPELRIFNFASCYRNTIDKIQFVGGSVQLAFSNANVDMTRLTIRDCCFQAWTQAAITAEGTGPDLHMSASLNIQTSVFDGGTMLVTRCDSTSIEHCRHQFRGSTVVSGTPSISNKWTGGVLRLTDFTATPAMIPDPMTGDVIRGKWVDNWGSVVADGCRFGGEGGGLPVITHNGGPNVVNPWMGRAITITNSQVCCGQNTWPESALITLNGVPQCIRVTGCRGIVSNTIPLIKVAPGYDLAGDVGSISVNAAPSLVMYSITMQGNQFYAPCPIPAPLQQFVK